MEGDSVTLSVSLTETQRKEGISWKFGPQERTIAEIDVGNNIISLYEERADGRFKGRLKLDHSGSLTITNIRTTDSGLYKVTQTSTDNQISVFNINVYGVFGSEFVSVMEGDSVTLSVSLTESQIEEGITWKFGPQEINAPETTIAEIEDKGNNFRFYKDRVEGRFRFRLKLDNQTGSLTITNTNITHSGLYKVINTKTKDQLKTFNITVYDHFPVHFISRVSPQNSASSSNCLLLCSVFNLSDVSVSWYKGNSLLSSISVSNIKTSVSLHLEVEYQDNNTYSCVLNHTIGNQTQHLNINEVCQPSSDFICCCGFTGVVIQLSVSALVGVTAVAVVVYDIRTR
ncbi:uncharacterized protein [Misgurnus anguillicaudatus]|uniref:uncharacterized protein n=1 Tax=Misgurnus anguillicaudatus TaxID=75329 RepID=UPI003CCF48B9